MADDFSYSNINDSESSTDENEVTGSARGLTIFTCSLFIIAEMAGSGILALPKAVSEAGWTGLFLLIFCCLLSLYCGILLGNCWMSVRTQNKRYEGHVRDPYPVIGFEAIGKPGKIIVEICVLVTLFGVCVVFLLLASQQISSLIDTAIGGFTVKNEFRLWILICGLALLPFSWLATPKDIWPFAIAATVCTIFAAIFICVRTGMYIHNHRVLKYSEQSHTTANSLFNSFGTIAFSFGGASVFPTFQADMRKPSQFKYAASIAFIFVLIMYIPVATLPYLAFGPSVNDDVLRTLKGLGENGKIFVKLAEALITFHLLFTLVITLNPITQQIEEYMKLPHSRYHYIIFSFLVTQR